MNRVLILFVPLLLFSACQEDRSNLIPEGAAKAIEKDIKNAKEKSAAGDCFGALEESAKARKKVEALRGEVSPVLRENLLEGVDKLQTLIQDGC